MLIECEELADAAEARGKEDVGLGIARFAFIAILASWLLAVVTASALVKVFHSPLAKRIWFSRSIAFSGLL